MSDSSRPGKLDNLTGGPVAGTSKGFLKHRRASYAASSTSNKWNNSTETEFNIDVDRVSKGGGHLLSNIADSCPARTGVTWAMDGQDSCGGEKKIADLKRSSVWGVSSAGGWRRQSMGVFSPGERGIKEALRRRKRSSTFTEFTQRISRRLSAIILNKTLTR